MARLTISQLDALELHISVGTPGVLDRVCQLHAERIAAQLVAVARAALALEDARARGLPDEEIGNYHAVLQAALLHGAP
jgi:hypothetical protein